MARRSGIFSLGKINKYNHTQPLSVFEPYSKDFPRNEVEILRQKLDQIIEIKAPVPFSENRGYCPSQAYETQLQKVPMAKTPLYENFNDILQFANSNSSSSTENSTTTDSTSQGIQSQNSNFPNENLENSQNAESTDDFQSLITPIQEDHFPSANELKQWFDIAHDVLISPPPENQHPEIDEEETQKAIYLLQNLDFPKK